MIGRPVLIARSIVVGSFHDNSKGKYRGVDVATGKVIFEKQFIGGTNNLFEFLAVVHALALVHGENKVVYTSSTTAIAWVRDRSVKSTAHGKRVAEDKVLFQILFKAIDWLHKHPVHNDVLRWEKEFFGESPAKYPFQYNK